MSKGVGDIEENVAYEFGLYLEKCKTGEEPVRGGLSIIATAGDFRSLRWVRAVRCPVAAPSFRRLPEPRLTTTCADFSLCFAVG